MDLGGEREARARVRVRYEVIWMDNQKGAHTNIGGIGYAIRNLLVWSDGAGWWNSRRDGTYNY